MIIVTGGAGFIGSAIAAELNAQGSTDILIVDQKVKSSAKEKNLKKLSYRQYLEADTFLEQLENRGFDGKIEAIFHQGACSSTTWVSIGTSMTTPFCTSTLQQATYPVVSTVMAQNLASRTIWPTKWV